MTHRTETPDAEAAGEEYAMEQLGAPEGHGLGGTFFMDWVHEQIIEASRMDPSTVLPLETKADAKVIARNMLQQLVWDVKRDLDGHDIARLIGIDIAEREDISAFFEGFEKVTDASRDWLADELLEINREMRGEGVSEARRGGRPPQRRGGMRESGSPADVLRTLQPGDMVTVESPELPRSRQLVVTHVGGHSSVYVDSGRVRPGHRSGGRLHVRDGVVFYDATIQQRPVRVSRLTRTAAAMAESRHGTHVKRIALKSERRKDHLGGPTRTVWVIYDVDTGDTISASTDEQAERERFQHYTSGEVFDGGVTYEPAPAAGMAEKARAGHHVAIGGRGEVIPSRHWRHRSGATASPYGAVPWTGAPGDREEDWQMETSGWTIQWEDGTVGIGRMPSPTREEAEAWLEQDRARREGARRALPPAPTPAPRRRRRRR
jgi:hypothetical protein